MSKTPFLIAFIAAATLGACAATAQESVADAGPASTMPVSEAATFDAAPISESALATCEVRTRRTDAGMLIQGRAFADSDIDGEYELLITKSGANESEITQAGPVSIRAGRSVTFGESEVSLERGSRLRAVLTLRDADGVICRETLSL